MKRIIKNLIDELIMNDFGSDVWMLSKSGKLGFPHDSKITMGDNIDYTDLK